MEVLSGENGGYGVAAEVDSGDVDKDETNTSQYQELLERGTVGGRGQEDQI